MFNIERWTEFYDRFMEEGELLWEQGQRAARR